MIQSLSHLKHGEFYFPMLDGTSGQVLVTDGNGQLTWQTQQTGTNKFLSALSFNTSDGILTATVSGSSNVTVDLDGRYSLSSHNHNNLYDNYRSWNLKTNGVQRTTVQTGGTLDLKAGSNVTLSYGAGGVVTIASTDTNTDNYADSLSFNTGNGILTLGRSGSLSDLTVDLDGRYSTTDTNNYISSVSFNTGNGILTLNRSGLTSLTVDLDGKYLTKTWQGGDDYFAGHHAEGRLLANAYLSNDLANARKRGSRFTLTNTSLSDIEIDRMFDGLSTFAGVPTADFTNGPVVIEFDIPRTLTYGAYVGIGFGNSNWRCKDVLIEAYSQGKWVTCIHETNNNYEDVYTAIPGNSGIGTTSFRITLDNPNADVRICHIWAYNYNSELWSQAIMPRSGGSMYGDLSLSGSLTAVGYNNSNWDTAYGWGDHSTQGYIKDGNSNWNNSYGFITASSGDTLTNKKGNISQWTNDAGYITSYTDTNTQLSDGDIAAMGYIKDGNTNWNNTYGFVTSSGNTIIGTDTDINTSGATIIDNLYMTDGVITSHGTRLLTAADLGIAKPAAPESLKLTIVNDTINVTFNESTDGPDNYLIFSSVAGGDYGLISVLSPEDMSATMSIIDNTFSLSGIIAYRVYAVKNGIYSDPATASVTFSSPSEDVSNLSSVSLNTAHYVQWNSPANYSRFVDEYRVYVDVKDTQASLTRNDAVVVYQGDNTNYMYAVSGSDFDRYHQFWVEVIYR